jgi:hypothetical protein
LYGYLEMKEEKRREALGKGVSDPALEESDWCS